MARQFCTLGWLAVALLLGSIGRGADHTVFIFDYYFTPTNLTVAPGDTVTWINRGANPHDTTEINGNWASPLLSNDEEFFSYTFNQAGRFPYICLVHIADFPQQTGLVVVASANLPPNVQITSPTEGAAFTSPGAFTLTASASDPDGSVNSVQFFVNGVSAGTSTGPSYSAAISGLSPGTYALTAVASDNLGATATSAGVNIVVREDTPTRFALTTTVVPAVSGTVSLDPTQPTEGYTAGTVVNVTASAAEGFVFNGWSGGASGAQNPLLVTMDGAKNVTANFSPSTVATYRLSLNTTPLGSGSIEASPAPNAGGGAYVVGTVVTLTAVPALDFAFTNWIGAVSGNNPVVTVTMDADKSVTANFFASISPRFTLNLVTNPAGAGNIVASPAPGPGGTYVQGTLVTVTATAVGTNSFTNWSGAVSGSSNRVTVLMDSDKTLTGTFVPIVPVRFALTTAVLPADAGTVVVTPGSLDGTYPGGTLLAVAAQASAGFRFVRWSGADSSTNNPILVAMTVSKVLTAEFAAQSVFDFDAARGVYTGLLLDESDTNYFTSGFFRVRLARSGAFRGTAVIGGMREAVAGQFDRFGYAPLVVRRASLQGSLQLDAGATRMSGSLTDDRNPNPTTRRTPELLLYREAMTNGSSFAGKYEVPVAAEIPLLNPGALEMDITSRGVVRIAGRLGDGTTFRKRTFLTPAASVPLFAPLYGNRGVILGWMQVAEAGEVQGTVRWFRPADSRSLTFPEGFALKIPVDGSRLE